MARLVERSTHFIPLCFSILSGVCEGFARNYAFPFHDIFLYSSPYGLHLLIDSTSTSVTR